MKKRHLVVFLVLVLLGLGQPAGGGGVAAASMAVAPALSAGPNHPSGPGRLAIVPMDEREPGAHPALGYLAFVVIAVFFTGAAIFIYRRYR